MEQQDRMIVESVPGAPVPRAPVSHRTPPSTSSPSPTGAWATFSQHTTLVPSASPGSSTPLHVSAPASGTARPTSNNSVTAPPKPHLPSDKHRRSVPLLQPNPSTHSKLPDPNIPLHKPAKSRANAPPPLFSEPSSPCSTATPLLEATHHAQQPAAAISGTPPTPPSLSRSPQPTHPRTSTQPAPFCPPAPHALQLYTSMGGRYKKRPGSSMHVQQQSAAPHATFICGEDVVSADLPAGSASELSWKDARILELEAEQAELIRAVGLAGKGAALTSITDNPLALDSVLDSGVVLDEVRDTPAPKKRAGSSAMQGSDEEGEEEGSMVEHAGSSDAQTIREQGQLILQQVEKLKGLTGEVSGMPAMRELVDQLLRQQSVAENKANCFAEDMRLLKEKYNSASGALTATQEALTLSNKQLLIVKEKLAIATRIHIPVPGEDYVDSTAAASQPNQMQNHTNTIATPSPSPFPFPCPTFLQHSSKPTPFPPSLPSLHHSSPTSSHLTPQEPLLPSSPPAAPSTRPASEFPPIFLLDVWSSRAAEFWNISKELKLAGLILAEDLSYKQREHKKGQQQDAVQAWANGRIVSWRGGRLVTKEKDSTAPFKLYTRPGQSAGPATDLHVDGAAESPSAVAAAAAAATAALVGTPAADSMEA
ncbi:MAG: hypothetical protein WDW38_009017 [Sanguina aurantia]